MADLPPEIFDRHGSDELVGHFQQYKVNFIVVGGVAVRIHNCREQFDVDDLDLLVEPTLDNARCIVDALSAATIDVQFKPEALARPGACIPLKVLHFCADILTPWKGIEFGELLQRSIPARLKLRALRVISRADLILMKEHAVSQLTSELEKHQRDLSCLRFVSR